mmetsp:Transcript_95005/g.132038  ORF Transcript_95005/g.132038 Transcript_95005/m.132038 type:complete len:252 (+) Transcript_95005:14-769(+)
MRKRFSSSRSVKLSMSCWGSLKKSSGSSSEEIATYSASTFLSSSSLRFWRRLRRPSLSRCRCCNSSSSSLRRCFLPRFFEASTSASSWANFSKSFCSSCARYSMKGARRSFFHLSARSFFLCSFLRFCSSFHSGGVIFSKNILYFSHSTLTSFSLLVSLCTVAICCFRLLILPSLSCLTFACISPSFVEEEALAILSWRYSSNFLVSSSRICWGIVKASSFAFAMASKRTISSLLLSHAMCTRKTSRFFCT